jgi:CheY-like chemotaxis protein
MTHFLKTPPPASGDETARQAGDLHRAAAPALPLPLPLPLKDLKILVADDAAENRELIQLFLARAGASVDEAVDGHDAVKKAVAGDYDAILMDLQMPGRDGHSATTVLRGMDYQKPIVALTGSAHDDEARRCMASGFSGYLTKPVLPAQLVSSVRAAIEAGAAAKRRSTAAPASPSTPDAIYVDFVAKLTVQCDEMRAAWERADWGKAERLAGRIKTLAGGCGLKEIMTSACAIENELHGERRADTLAAAFAALVAARDCADHFFPLS